MCDQNIPFHDYNCPKCATAPVEPLSEDVFSQVHDDTCDGTQCACGGCPEAARDKTEAEVIDDLANENSELRSELDKQDGELDRLFKLAESLAEQAANIEAETTKIVEEKRIYIERLSFAIHILRAIAVNGTQYVESNRELALLALATVSAGDYAENLEKLSDGLK